MTDKGGVSEHFVTGWLLPVIGKTKFFLPDGNLRRGLARSKHILYGALLVIALLLRLFALRPFLAMGIFGIPVMILIAVGLVTIFAVKALVFFVLPAVLIIWLVRKAYKSAKAREMFEGSPSI